MDTRLSITRISPWERGGLFLKCQSLTVNIKGLGLEDQRQSSGPK